MANPRPMGGPGGRNRHGYQKPKNMGKTIRKLMEYLGRSKWLLLIVAVCLVLYSVCTIGGSYLLKPLVNEAIIPGDYGKLARTLGLMTCIYVAGAGFSFTYTRIMVHVSQKTSFALRRDLFAKMQTLPLSYFDTHTHGELMSRYTNDIETITEIMNNGLASLISGSLTFVGVVLMMIITSPILFLVTIFCLGLMFLVVMTVGKRSRYFFAEQQRYASLRWAKPSRALVSWLKTLMTF